jgi:hypothetical protein
VLRSVNRIEALRARIKNVISIERSLELTPRVHPDAFARHKIQNGIIYYIWRWAIFSIANESVRDQAR